MSNLIGTAPDQVPVNGMLGDMAFQNNDSVNIKNLTVTSQTVKSQLNLTNESDWNLYASGAGANWMAGGLVIGSSPFTQYNGVLQLAAVIDGGGVSTSHGLIIDTYIESDVTTTSTQVLSSPNTTASVFTLTNIEHFRASGVTIGAGSTVTNQYGFVAESSLIGATNNYGFYGNIPAGTGRYNLYMAGTANNYLAGSLGIGAIAGSSSMILIGGNGSLGSVANIILNQQTISTSTTSAAVYYDSFANLAASAFTLNGMYHYRALSATLSGGAVVTNQYGFFAGPSLTGATNNYGFCGNIPSGTGCYNLYMGGTATNYLAGSLGLGIVPPTGTRFINQLQITGATTSIGQYATGIIQSDVTAAFYHRVEPQTAAAVFTTTVEVFGIRNTTIGTGATISSLYGFSANSTMVTTGVTNAYSFRGDLASGTGRYNLYMAGTASNYLAGPLITAGLKATSAAAPTIASATTIAPTTQIAFVSGTAAIATITPPSPISLGGGQITLIPLSLFTTNTTGNIALASSAVVNKALIMTYDVTTAKWYPSY